MNNKFKLISFSSCSNDSFNCSSNLFWNPDSALPVQTVDTKHINRECKVPRRLPIEDSASVNSKTTTPVLTCSCSSLLPKRVFFSDTMQSLSARVHVITVLPKIGRPKSKDEFVSSPVHQDVDDNLFLSPANGLAIRRTIKQPPQLEKRTDLITWDRDLHEPQLKRDLQLSDNTTTIIQDAILRIIRDNWDAFDEQGVNRPVIGYEFCIDTSGSPPVCCRLPKYGIHESKVMTTQIQALENSKWIRDCEGPWGAMILLAPKPHKENVTNIQDFIWRLCVSYRALNAVTKFFIFFILRCADSIEDFGDSNGPMFFINLDARQGYHQITVSFSDQEKLAIFCPDGSKKTFEVMPFGTKNAPLFYTAIMK